MLLTHLPQTTKCYLLDHRLENIEKLAENSSLVSFINRFTVFTFHIQFQIIPSLGLFGYIAFIQMLLILMC